MGRPLGSKNKPKKKSVKKPTEKKEFLLSDAAITLISQLCDHVVSTVTKFDKQLQKSK